MRFHRLAWRIGLPFVLVVLAATGTLVVQMQRQIAAEERARLERLCAADAAFLQQNGFRPTERMAEDLQRLTGFAVHFRRGDRLIASAQPGGAAESPTAPLTEELAAVPADGATHRCGDHDCVAVTLDGDDALLLVRTAGTELRDPRVLQVLVAFWALALGIAWLAARGLVRPLRHLAAQLPRIESTEPVELPEAGRADEIGDVARAFLRTREALHDERQQRARAEKLAVLGRMTAALAHEVQNPVAAIKLHAQLARGGPADGFAATVEQEVARIEGLLNQWLFLGRPEPPALRPLDLAELLAEVVAAHRARCEHARVRVDLEAPGPVPMLGDGRRLGQVFANLLINAVQAMPAGGTVRVRATSRQDAVEVTVADEGRGFSPAALARFGEFFFTEKEGGMGIGLCVAREIVAAHGGTLRAENAAAGGAVVTVVLPLAGNAPPTTAP